MKLTKTLLRRFPVKTMLMAIGGRLLAHRNFDGKIHLERVSKSRLITTRTSHHNFSDDVIVNDKIKSDSWKDIVSQTDIYGFDLIHLLEETCNLEGYILDRIGFFVMTKIGQKGNTKDIVSDNTVNINKVEIREHDDKNLPPHTCTLADIGIRVRNEVGDTVADDYSCDSTYMIAAMDRVGRAIQVPRSSYTNVLDLGFWMALQARVERQHFLKRATTHALVNSVNEVWNTSELDQCLI